MLMRNHTLFLFFILVILSVTVQEGLTTDWWNASQEKQKIDARIDKVADQLRVITEKKVTHQ